MNSLGGKLASLVERYKKIETGTLGHLIDKGFMDPRIRPVWKGGKIVAPAFTVRLLSYDTGIMPKVYQTAPPGSVVVIDQRSDITRACFGEIAAYRAMQGGLVGTIIDGSTTDIRALEKLAFPVFSRGISALTGRPRNEDGDMGGSIICGGVPVNTGDLVIADDDGIVVLTIQQAEELVEEAEAYQVKEGELIKQLKEQLS